MSILKKLALGGLAVAAIASAAKSPTGKRTAKKAKTAVKKTARKAKTSAKGAARSGKRAVKRAAKRAA